MEGSQAPDWKNEIKSDWSPLFRKLQARGRINTPSEATVYASGAYGAVLPQRGYNTDGTMRFSREGVFGNNAARLPSESDTDYIKRSCPSASQSESRPPRTVRTRLVPGDFLTQAMFCPVPSTPDPKFCGKGAMLCLMDEGSVIDPHSIWPHNRTFVILRGCVVLIFWPFKESSLVRQFCSSSSTLGIFFDHTDSRRLVEKGIKPSILKVCEGKCVIVRAGTFVSVIALQHTGNSHPL